MDINLLKVHPKNNQIYGVDNIEEIAEAISEKGFIKPLIINQNNVIISGHRRYLACKELNIQDVPVEIRNFNSEQEELETLLLENMYRNKTTEQKVKEAEMWEVIEKEKAEKRRLLNLKQNSERENFPSRTNEGRVSDIVAKQVGIGSGKTLETAKIVVRKIDELRHNGDDENASFLSEVLNKTVSGAKKLVDTVTVEKIPKVIKEQVKKGDLSINQAYILTKSAEEAKRKNEENERLYKEQLEKEREEREQKKRLEELEASLPKNTVMLEKFRKPEEKHIFGIADFNNLTEEQLEKCLNHAKKYNEAISKVLNLYTSRDSLKAWECTMDSQEELELKLSHINSAVNVLLEIQNYFRGVKKIEKPKLNERS